MRSIQAVRATIHTHATLAKKKVAQPGLDPRYTDLDSLYKSWGDALPRHLRVYYPVDGSAPKLPFHFVANLHSYHNLSIIMHTRPQLMSTPDPLSETWRRPMLVSYSAAKRLCQLQESILQHFGLPGLLCMLRGINFTIYGILTCTMLHLVCPSTLVSNLISDGRCRSLSRILIPTSITKRLTTSPVTCAFSSSVRARGRCHRWSGKFCRCERLFRPTSTNLLN